MIENNDVGSQVCHSIFYEYEYDMIINADRKALGIRSHKRTKLEACIALKEYIERGYMKIYHGKTKTQLSMFEEQTNGTFSGGKTPGVDDLVSALQWIAFYFVSPYVEFPGSEALEIHNIEEKNKIEENWEVPYVIIGGENSYHEDPVVDDFMQGYF